MIVATFQIMWLRLWRDKGAFALAFLLPGVIFSIFAAIFSTASGGTLDLRVAMTADPAAPLVETLIETATFDAHYDRNWTSSDLSEAVKLGQFDVGVHVHDRAACDPSPVFTVFADPNRSVATTVLKGQLRQFMAQQSGIRAPELFETRSVLGQYDGPDDQSVTYYVGAVAILFLLFSAMQAAALSIDERRNGITDRLMLGQAGVVLRLIGKLGFITLIGCLQAGIIVAVAVLGFDVGLDGHYFGIAMACLSASFVAASLGVLLASVCETQPQMHAVSTFLVLVFSAIGGSMVPRFMMPSWLQDISQFTPNHWVIEAFYGVLARGQSVASLWPVWGVLYGVAVICFIVAAGLSHRLRRG